MSVIERIEEKAVEYLQKTGRQPTIVYLGKRAHAEILKRYGIEQYGKVKVFSTSAGQLEITIVDLPDTVVVSS